MTEKIQINRETFVYELADGTTGTVTPGNPDQIAWEKTAASRYPGYGGRKQSDGSVVVTGAITQTTFVIWHALKRAERYTDTFERFRDTDLEAFDMLDAETIDPT